MTETGLQTVSLCFSSSNAITILVLREFHFLFFIKSKYITGVVSSTQITMSVGM